MKNYCLKILVILTLTFCLPLTGMGVMLSECPCSGHEGQDQIHRTLMEPVSPEGCCDHDSSPPPAGPCQCSKNFCDLNLETKNPSIAPLVSGTVVFIGITDLKGFQATLLRTTDEPPFFDSNVFFQQFLYLHNQSLRC